MKWGCLQPLTGGMYLGAEEALGCPASWIISYPGLDSTKVKDGKIVSAGNEYSLLEYLKKKDRQVPYFNFCHSMFDDIAINEVEIVAEDSVMDHPDFKDIDIVVGVPVCSGLSQATIAGQETKESRNCNMRFLANYALSVIRPKVYIFENAPGLMSDRGDEMRGDLEGIALRNGYSVLYFKTDTMLHGNCQRRPRTFVMFQRWRDGKMSTPYSIRFCDERVSPEEYLGMVPPDATQNVPFKMSVLNEMLLEYLRSKFGTEWRQVTGKTPMDYIVKHSLCDSLLDFVEENADGRDVRRMVKWINHAKMKHEQGLNYYSMAIWTYDKNVCTPSVQFKSLQSLLHHSEDRLLTTREALWLMGMPMDFELAGDPNTESPKIGQNVPVGTARYIVSEARRWIEDWDNPDERTDLSRNTSFYDNTKKRQFY